MSEKISLRQAGQQAMKISAQIEKALTEERQREFASMSRETDLEDSLARIRGLLDAPVRYEDPECCLFMISGVVQDMLGDRAGIMPNWLEER